MLDNTGAATGTPAEPAADNYSNYIPPQVRQAAQRADELVRGVVAEDPAPPEPEVPEAPAPVVAPPAAPVEDSWEQRFRTLQGKYDSEISRAHQRNAEVSNMQAQIANLQQLLASMQSAPARPETTTTVVIPAEDASEYGEDLITAARRWARAEVQPELEQMQRQLTQLNGNQQNLAVQTAQQRVEATLNGDPVIGGVWERINHDPQFFSWLAQEDSFTGAQRHALLNDAYQRGDGARCVKFFRAFLAEHTAEQAPTPAAAQTPPVPDTRAEVAGPRTTLESLAAPGRATGTAATGGATTEKRIWTNDQIRRFYDDRTKGKFRGREAEMQRVEQDIFTAMSEGRIQR